MTNFWSKVNKNGPIPDHKPELGKCWVWIAYKNRDGYGRIRIAGTRWLAHRYSFSSTFGLKPPAVLHKCDNPACVNPDHLYAGTQAQNMIDKVRANRQSYTRGEHSGQSKVTEEQVRQIRRLRAAGITCKEVVRILGIDLDPSQVSRIGNRVWWSHIQDG